MSGTHIIVLILAGCGLILATEYYSDVFDQTDVDSILASDRLTNQYVACLLDKGPCTADGRSLKRIIPEALYTGCLKCTDKQKIIAKKIITHLRDSRHSTWLLVQKQYDPRDEYANTFEKKLGI